MTDDVRSLIIIGSGPSGYTAAIYAARANLEPLVFEGSVTAGGALMNTTDVENFPGFPDGIMGPALMDNLRAQAERFGAELVVRRRHLGRPDRRHQDRGAGRRHHATARTRWSSRWARATASSASRARTRSRATASAGAPRATASSSASKDIVVVGGGDSAVEEATFLTRFADKVTLVHRRDELRASKIMAGPRLRQRQDRVRVEQRGRRDPRRRHRSRASPCATPAPARPAASTPAACSSRSATTRARSCSTGQVDLDDEGYVLVQPGSTATNLRGVFAAGDLVDHTYRQAITAAGTGCAGRPRRRALPRRPRARRRTRARGRPDRLTTPTAHLRRIHG